MLDVKLITRQEIQQYKQLSNSSKDAKLDQVIIEAQLREIKPLLGERLFNAVLRDVQNAGNTNGNAYTNLLNGGDYTVGGVERYNPGLKAVLAHHVYARYIMWGDVQDNPFGATIKLNPNQSEPVSLATKKSLYIEGKDVAFNIWQDVRKFLILTKEPLFDYKCAQPKRSMKLKKIGANHRTKFNRHGYNNRHYK